MILLNALVEFKKILLKIAWFIPGFLLFAAFPPMGEKVDILFALAPLMVLSRGGNPKKSAWCCFQSGAFFWVATLSWMPAIIKNNGPWPLVVLGWAALAAYCASFFALYGWLSAKYWAWAKGLSSQGNVRFVPLRRLLGCLVVEPVLWCGLELVRSRLFGGFAWNQLGVVPANTSFASLASLGGVYLLSAVVVLINGVTAGIAERFIATARAKMRKTYDATALGKFLSLETVFAFALIYGIYHYSYISSFERERMVEPLRVAMIQRNFPCCFAAREERPLEIYSNLFERVSMFAPDIAVLPESAMGEIGRVDGGRAAAFAAFARRISGAKAILAGGERKDEFRRLYNSAALYEDGRKAQVYDKVHLVPFGEFIPGDKIIPALQALAPVGSCTPGEEKLLYLHRPGKKEIPFGVAICFEDTDSALMRSLAAKGARFLCFITNDSWFSNSIEAQAHAWQATARAVETGLPVVRTGNSGVSGVIFPNGSVNLLLSDGGKPLVDASGVMCDTIAVPCNPSDEGGKSARTVYVKHGDIPLVIIFTLLITAMIMVKYGHEYKRIRRMPVQIG